MQKSQESATPILRAFETLKKNVRQTFLIVHDVPRIFYDIRKKKNRAWDCALIKIFDRFGDV